MSPGAVAEALILPLDDAAAVRRLVRKHAGELACILFEPRAGVLDLAPEFVREVRRVARDCGVPFIFDEIVAFRMAWGGAQQHYAIDPDLTAFGKIVGGGFPVGAFGGRAELMDLLDPARGQGSGQSGTYSAHPVTMAAGAGDPARPDPGRGRPPQRPRRAAGRRPRRDVRAPGVRRRGVQRRLGVRRPLRPRRRTALLPRRARDRSGISPAACSCRCWSRGTICPRG